MQVIEVNTEETTNAEYIGQHRAPNKEEFYASDIWDTEFDDPYEISEED